MVEVEPIVDETAEVEAFAVAVTEPHTAPDTLLSRLMDIIDGDLCTKVSGVNQPIYFRSREISGLKRARKIKSAIEELIGFPAQLNSVRQAEIDREAPFDWAGLTVKAGERVLQSGRFDNLSDLLARLGTLADGSLLRSSLSVLADFDADGEAYSVVTSAIKGADNLRQFRFELERRFGGPFRAVAGQGVESELTPTSRAH